MFLVFGLNGWYHILNSDEIAKGTVKFVDAIGTQFAVFRGKNGILSVLNAFCPHLGANLAQGLSYKTVK